jgi:polyferredoxin
MKDNRWLLQFGVDHSFLGIDWFVFVYVDDVSSYLLVIGMPFMFLVDVALAGNLSWTMSWSSFQHPPKILLL